MSLNRFHWRLLSLVMSWGVLFTFSAQAATSNAFDFTSTPILPANQLTPNVGYYDLQVTPGKTQLFQLIVKNRSTHKRTLKIDPVNAITADTGIMVTAPSDRSDASAETTFIKMTSPVQTVTLAPHQHQTVTFSSKIPANGFRGEVRGGFMVSTLEQPTNKQQPTGLSLKNHYTMTTTVLMQCTPHQHLSTHLELANINVTRKNNQPLLTARIRNLTPAAFGQLKIKADVISSKTNQIVATQTLKDLSMAPNSWFDHPVSLGKSPLVAGSYQLNLHLSSGKRQWEFTKPFTLTKQTVQLHNQAQPSPARTNHWWQWLLLLGLAILALVIAAYQLGRRHS